MIASLTFAASIPQQAGLLTAGTSDLGIQDDSVARDRLLYIGSQPPIYLAALRDSLASNAAAVMLNTKG
jgi:ribosomal protein RSM22 (predicted rRNA methylase)